ncbi:MAG: hypothetical protein QGG40_08355, partial [Myxococcota bacterium]|nr:hypothetical protein [Myxococcota bacterium]
DDYLDIYGWITDLVEPTVQDALGDFSSDLEETIEDAFSQAVIQEEFEVQGATVTVDLFPSDIDISTDGLRMTMSSAFSANAAECISDYDPQGSLATASNPPDIGETPSEITSTPHVAALPSDDMLNQAIYAFWRGGVLCYTIDEDLFALDTSILGLLAGEAFDDLFPEAAPMIIETRPQKSPLVNFAGEHDLVAEVEAMGLDFIAEVDHRMAVVVGIDLDLDVPVDLSFDPEFGSLDIEVGLDTQNIGTTVTTNELVPDSSSDIEANFGQVIDTLAGSLLESQLDDLSFNFPGLVLEEDTGEISDQEPLGVTDLEAAGAGDNLDWFGTYLWLGTVEYEASGCNSEDGGCGGCDSGCEGGCTTTGRGANQWALFALSLALFVLRRRPVVP